LVTGNLTGFGKAAALTIPSVLAAAGVQDEEEIAELQQDKEKLAVLLERGYKNLNLNASPEEVDAFVRANVAEGGRIGYAIGGDTAEDNAMQASGIMGLPLNENPAGVTELDLRETGGFIPPVGVKEKADDIPAMLSNNEFVFTADAVRGMGGGDVDKGAERMYAMMKTLENGGRV
jgi:NAD(P)-dependent dehydrogenase (short-subunit alcohol dehydrogenase family)